MMRPRACWWLVLVCVASLAACEADPGAPADAGKAADAGGNGAPFDIDAHLYAGQPSGATARYELQSQTEWHALPFPNDLRLNSNGSVDLSGFPAPRDGSTATLLQEYIASAPAALKGGFSIQPTIYVQFDAPLGKDELYAPLDSASQFGTYFLTAVDPESPDYAKPVPVRAAYSPPKRGQYLLPNMLMVQPVWGRPLRPNTHYALVVRRSMRDAQGKILGQPAVLTQLVQSWRKKADPTVAHPELAKLAAVLEPLRKAIAGGALPVAWEDLAAVTVFRTGDPTAELDTLAKWVRKNWQAQAATDWKVTTKGKAFWILEAHYPSPNFQQGACPYDDQGTGGFAWDAQGNPKVDHVEQLRVSIMLPVERPLDGSGKTPLVLSAHGTGGNYLSYAQGGENKISDRLAAKGLAIASIDQPMHGPRCSPELTDTALNYKTFNYLNMSAGRGGFRQSAIDSVVLTMMARQGLLDPPAQLSPNAETYQFDPERVSFIGHSQGGISGALVAAIEPSLRAFVLSGAGAGLSVTVIQRVEPVPIAELVTKLLLLDPKELSEFHPAVSLVQTLADVVDPLAYARFALTRPDGVRPPDILLTEGLNDVDTPSDTSEALAASMGLDVLAPIAHMSDAMKLRDTKVLYAPVTGNTERNGFPITALVAQWAHDGHFAIFDNAKAASLYAHFLSSAAETFQATADFSN